MGLVISCDKFGPFLPIAFHSVAAPALAVSLSLIFSYAQLEETIGGS